jgi:hypothetical protein
MFPDLVSLTFLPYIQIFGYDFQTPLLHHVTIFWFRNFRKFKIYHQKIFQILDLLAVAFKVQS